MALHDNPPHRVTTYTSVTDNDDGGGGTALTFTTAQSALPCSIDTASASERELFAQQGIVVTHKIGILTSAITTAIVRGMKVVTDDRSESYHVRGISAGRSYGSIPAFTYLFCEMQV
jgi:molybdopterin synthase catalytic subunit